MYKVKLERYEAESIYQAEGILPYGIEAYRQIAVSRILNKNAYDRHD